MAAPARRSAAVVPRPRGAGPRALARARRLPRVAAPPRGRRAVGLLRGAADRQRPPGLPPRPRARVQGHLPALQDDARLLRRAQGRLGLPRAAGRDRRRAAARASQNKAEIEAYGIAEFNQRAASRSSSSWRTGTALTERIGFWIDLDDAYRTLDPTTSSRSGGRCAQIWRQGPALRGPQGRALLPALRHGAVLATRSRWATRTSSTRSVYVRFPVVEDGGPLQAGDELLVWTTTPWTLVSNAAVAVDPELTYVRAKAGRRTRPSCSPRRSSSACSAEGAEVLDRFPGAALDGVRYEPPFPLHRRRRLRRARPHRPARRLRHRRGRHRPRAHRDRLRRGRLPPGRSSTA